MTNGQQKAEQYENVFRVWSATQTADDVLQNIHRGSINRNYIADGVGCSRSALNQNPRLRALITEFEQKWRLEGVLPPLTESAKSTDPDKENTYDPSQYQNRLNAHRVSQQEQKIIALEAENKSLRDKLARYVELSEVLAEMGMIPR